MSTIRLFTLLICIATATACQQPPAEAEETFNVDIRWTSHGIPHVKADNWGSLGYGFAYATATDAVCVIARDLVMVNGELSRYFGPADDNLTSDVFHKSVLTADKVAEFNAAQSPRANEFSQGYVAGYNRFLTDHSESLPASCNKQPWVQPMQPDDVTRLAMGVGVRYGLGRFKNEIANAAPDGAADSASESDNLAAAIQDTQWDLPAGIGSNAVAVGSALSASGRGILLGNPHYPWHGSSRFHLIHTTIPGELDVMGTSLLNTTRVSIGFNKDVAWTHTVSTAMRFTLYQLKLNPDNPMQYEYDGEYRDVEPRVVRVTVGEGAQQQTREHTVYETAFGPIMENAELPWSSSHAYAIRDAVLNNYLTADTYDAMNKASSTAELEEAITRQGVYWVNTIGADRHGNAFYADISGTPNIDADLLDACRVEVAEAPERVVILDGARSACEWRDDQRSRVKGALPPADMPRMTTAQYVTNSNDSYWLTNPDQPLEGYSPIIGAERTARSLRTRAGLHMMGELLARDAKITPDDIQAMLYNHRNYGAELLLDDVLVACANAPAVQQACQALADWDRTMNVDSRGGHLWREFWDTARNIDNLWSDR
ncbi:MAG: penicillin acylase family protein, partial [Pseudomonadales bacterium]